MDKTSPCDKNRINAFLRGEIADEHLSELELHLEGCRTCRERLADESADAEWWTDAKTFLTDDDMDEHSISDLTSPSDLRLDRSVSERYVLESLAPSDDPRMLGRLAGYEIAGVIGAGGMGVVLKGFDGALNRYVAIKVLAPHLAESAAARRRFAREAQAAAAVVHENIIAIHGVSEANGLPYLVMPYERSASLQKRLNEVGVLGLTEILRIATQTASGLAAAHQQGLVHRDIKPANLLLADGVERVAITDFGLARAVDDASLTRTGIIAGTPQYMSPEQAAGEPIDFRSDLFSLGSVIYAMGTGRPPFRADSSLGVLRKIAETQPKPICEINPEIPSWLDRIVKRLHEKSPDNRFQTADEVSELLEDCLAHLQQPTAVPLPPEVEFESKDDRTSLWRIPFAAVLLFAIIAGVVGWPTSNEPVSTQPQDQRDEQVSSEIDSEFATNSIVAGGQQDTKSYDSSDIETPDGIDFDVDANDPIDVELSTIIIENTALEEEINASLEDAFEQRSIQPEHAGPSGPDQSGVKATAPRNPDAAE